MRAILVVLHRWFGLFIAGFLIIAGLTGALISWDHELDEWLNPHLFESQSEGQPLPMLELVDRVEQAGFAVLKEPEMVSILVETGFISNPTEERNLRSSAHQDKLARSIVNGVDAYFRNHPAPHSWYAAQRREHGEQYRIQPGDTLSEIARQYSVSEQAIRSANALNGDRIVVGQVLKIPRS